MRVLALFLPLLAAAEKIDLKLGFDEKLEGRVGVQRVEEEVVEKMFHEAEVIESPSKAKAALEQRDELLISPANFGAMVDIEKRQSSCPSGYGYCSNSGRCCPEDSTCCNSGYCCYGNQECCGSRNCMARGAQCCRDGSHCPAGNNCYTMSGYSRMVCCTNSQCTAVVDQSGSTSSASTSTTTREYTTTAVQYYYWTVTWWYYYYYWTYSYEISASIVTSSETTTYSTLSVRTTDAAAASDYFSSVSRDITLPTPASATSLESLAGSTSFVGETSASGTDSDNDNPEPTLRSGGDDDDGNNGGGSGGSDGGNDNAARGLFGSLDLFMVMFLTFGVGVGAVAVLL